jgi:hypothetical protein
MEIELAGEKIELKFTFSRIKAIEEVLGSIYNYPEKCGNKTVTVSDIVSIYYNAQEAAYSEEQIFKKIVADGLVNHITITYDVVMRFIVGEEITKRLEEDAKKEPEKK